MVGVRGRFAAVVLVWLSLLSVLPAAAAAQERAEPAGMAGVQAAPSPRSAGDVPAPASTEAELPPEPVAIDPLEWTPVEPVSGSVSVGEVAPEGVAEPALSADASSEEAGRSAGGKPARSVGPVTVRAGKVPGVLPVALADAALAARAGADGYLVQLGALDVGNSGSGRASERVDLELDYSAVTEKFGAGYAARLQLRVLPACALAVPVPKGCRASGELVESVTDFERKVLKASVVVPVKGQEKAFVSESNAAEARSGGSEGFAAESASAPESGGVMLAMSSGSSGPLGSFAATPVSMSSQWLVGPGTGGFSWSYPVPLQAGPAGDAPDVSLGYSSAAIDGMTGGENNQAPSVGAGFGLTEAFIERSYVACSSEGVSGAQDLCWRSDNAVLHLNGVSTQLVKVSALEWKAKDDPGWRVHRNTGAPNGDDNGEYWQVTTPDGVLYQFGRGVFPGEETTDTGSVWTVPVWGDDAGDPCSTGLGFCQQAWRWNLDRVVDPSGNRIRYTYETEPNAYRQRFYNVDQTYTRAGRVNGIAWGLRAGSASQSQSRVVFDGANRCSTLTLACPAATSSNGSMFPDVPNDLICAASCTKPTPTFFSARRVYKIRPQVWDGSWRDVDHINLVHEFVTNHEDADADGVNDVTMQLRYLDRQAQGDGTSTVPHVSVPTIRFDGCTPTVCSLLANRRDSDPSAGVLALKQWRIGMITTDTGAQIKVTYGQPKPCTTIPTGSWDTNYTDCFPKGWDPPDSPPGFAVWNKYLVTEVRVTDPVGGSPDAVTSYSYEGMPAWHYEDSGLYAPSEGMNTWNVWRGYAVTSIVDGVAPATTKRRVIVYRGMDGDRLAAGGTKSVSVTAGDGSAYVDANWKAGRVLDEQQWNAAGTTVSGVKHDYETRVTAGSGADAARWVGETAVTERVNEGGTRTRKTLTVYNTNRLPERVEHQGWTDISTDDRCTKTTYASDMARWMLAYPSTQSVQAGLACTAATSLRSTQTLYDGSATLHALPGAGNATKLNVIVAGVAQTRQTSTFDPLGRPVTVTDALGHTTSTAYAPASTASTSVHADVVTVTNPLGQVASNDFHARRIGTPVKSTDPNGRVTSMSYDALGRLTKVFLPSEQPPSANPTPSWEFQYDWTEHSRGWGVANPMWTRTARLQDKSTAPVEVTYQFETFDTLGRSRQRASLPETGTGAVIERTGYDARGLTVVQTGPQRVTFAPHLLDSATSVNKTTTTYDSLGRPITAAFATSGVTQWSTSTAYTYNTVTVTPPVGGVRRTINNAHGETAQVSEKAGTLWADATYAYTAAGELASITDPGGNVISYSYDEQGRRVGMVDPDAGTWAYAYDAVGNQTRTQDADPATPDLYMDYDALSRPTKRSAGNPATGGVALAEWFYDQPGELGLLDRSVRHHPTRGDFVVDIAGYDVRGRPTGKTWVIPGSMGPLAGTYTNSFGYDEADHVGSVSFPAVAGLPSETVITDYSPTIGAARTLTSSVGTAYVSGTTFDPINRVSARTLGTGAHTITREYSFDPHLRLTGWKATGATTGLLQDDRIARDAVGNVASRHDARPGVDQFECFGYDTRHRLTSAVTKTGSCTGPAGGPTPYSHTYTYSLDGRVLSRDEGTGPIAYTYPAVGAERPHAVTSVGSDSYTYDPNGQMTARPGDTGSQQLAWDAEHRIGSITETGSTTQMVYDADGTRLVRADPTTTTVYLDGTELSATPTGVTGKRSYTAGTMTVAVRDNTGRVDWLLGDHLGTTTVTVNAATGIGATQRFLPYGKPRTPTTGVTERGWIGQTRDTTTGLQYLNARYYDPNTGRFLSTDPLLNTAEVQSLDRYGYGRSNPITLTDPTGLDPDTSAQIRARGMSIMGGSNDLVPGITKARWWASVGRGPRARPYVGPDFVGPTGPEVVRDPRDWCHVGGGPRHACGPPPAAGAEYSGQTVVAVLDLLSKIGGPIVDGGRAGSEKVTSTVVVFNGETGTFIAYTEYVDGFEDLNKIAAASRFQATGRIVGRAFVVLQAGLTMWSSWNESKDESIAGRVSYSIAETAITGTSAWAGALAVGRFGGWVGSIGGPVGIAVGTVIGTGIGAAGGYVLADHSTDYLYSLTWQPS